MRFRRLPFLCVFLCALGVWGQAPTDCSYFNFPTGPYPTYNEDFGQHYSTGKHYWINEMRGSCSYFGTGNQYTSTPCGVHSTSTSTSTVDDTGYVSYAYWHTGGYSDKNGIADGPLGGSATTDAEGAAAISSCAPLPCGMSVNISGGGYGGGFSVSYSPTPYWQKSQYYKNSECTARILPPSTSCTPPGPPPYELTPPQYWRWDTTTCTYVLVNGTTPVIVDTKNNGFQFTDPRKGEYVSFDLKGDGSVQKFSWPKQGSGDMWLVLPDANGQVKTGQQLFGNYTAHSDGGDKGNPSANGFLALAWYDRPDQGGDGNLIMDGRDRLWASLRLWDATRCLKNPNNLCVSQPGELYTLQSQGIYSISLVWGIVNAMPSQTTQAFDKTGYPVYGPLMGLTDLVGNEYKWYAVLNPDAETTPTDDKGNSCCELHKKSKDPRWAIDVSLVSLP